MELIAPHNDLGSEDKHSRLCVHHDHWWEVCWRSVTCGCSRGILKGNRCSNRLIWGIASMFYCFWPRCYRHVGHVWLWHWNSWCNVKFHITCDVSITSVWPRKSTAISDLTDDTQQLPSSPWSSERRWSMCIMKTEEEGTRRGSKVVCTELALEKASSA